MNRARSATLVMMAVLTLALALPDRAWAQGGAGATGSISGEVKDGSGGALPGVTVTATGPSLIGQQQVVTNEQGLYRFPSLPAGEYRLVFELPGFSTFDQAGIRLGIGVSQIVNASLGVATLQETITVSGATPTIDTTATRLQSNYSQDQLSSIPNSRDMWSLLAATPSITLTRIDVGGNTAGTQTAYVAYGHTGQNRPLVEGINSTEGTAANGLYIDYGSFEEVFVGAAGNSAEMPNPGVLTQFVSKSGGNRLSVNLYYDYENKNAQSKNLEAEQIVPFTAIPVDGNRLSKYQNMNLGVGGPLMKDRIWGFGAFSYQENEVAAPANGIIQDGTVFTTSLRNETGKATWQLNQANKLIGYVQYGTKHQPYRVDATNRVSTPVHLTSASTLDQNLPGWVFKGEWNRTIGQTGFLEARAGQFGYDWTYLNHTNDPRYEDLGTSEVRGGGRDWELDRRRDQFTAAYSLFRDNLLGGAHNFKFGGEYLYETARTAWFQGYRDQVVHYLTSGRPSAVRLYATPSDNKSGVTTASLFVTDTWSLKKLTLNVGGRYDRYNGFLPEQTHEAGRFVPTATTFEKVGSVYTFNHIVPRLGATYDLTGNGQTVLKANWGRFYFNPGVGLADTVNPNTADQYSDYVWSDLNGNLLYDAGEEGALQTKFGGVANAAIDPNLENSYMDEASAFVERVLFGNLSVRGGYVYRKDKNGWQQVNDLRPFSAYSAPVTVIDPTTGLGVPLLNLDDTTRGSLQVARNVPGYEGSYRTIEITANKRYATRWSLNASYSYTWTQEYNSIYFGNRFGTAVSNFSFGGNYPTNPNESIFNDFGGWAAKITGTVDAGWGFRVTPIMRAQNGAPYGRVINATLNYGAQRILVEPIGTRQQDAIVVFDIRAEKQVPLGKAKVGLFLDVFNLTNANTAIQINWLSGTTFERPTVVLSPRIAKFGVKFDW
jgi:hypothetical protein